MFGAFTAPSISVSRRAEEIAASMGADVTGTVHLLLALGREPGTLPNFALRTYIDELVRLAGGRQSRLIEQEADAGIVVIYTRRLCETIIVSNRIALALNEPAVQPHHMFLAILANELCAANQLLKAVCLSLDILAQLCIEPFGYEPGIWIHLEHQSIGVCT